MYTALEDIKLQTVDFAWIKQTVKVSHLKRAIKLIEFDGDYYSELKEACYDRIGELDPTQKRIKVDNRMMPQIKAEIDQELEQWQQELIQRQKVRDKSLGPHEDLDPEQYFDKQSVAVDRLQEAENLKTKGNEAIKSRDYQEAIRYYTQSLSYNPSLYQSLGNRALAYLRLKDFQKALTDCEAALKINSQYAKAYHRKAKALIGMKKRVQAYKSFQDALKIQPENSELIAQLKDTREEMTKQELKTLQGNREFKKIVIEEDSDSEQEQIQQK